MNETASTRRKNPGPAPVVIHRFGADKSDSHRLILLEERGRILENTRCFGNLVSLTGWGMERSPGCSPFPQRRRYLESLTVQFRESVALFDKRPDPDGIDE